MEFHMISILHHKQLRLIQTSFLMLFVELTIIRWTGSNLYYLFAFSNVILIASFLGIGLGFLRPTRRYHLFNWSPVFLCLLIFICYYFSVDHVVRLNPVTDNINYASRYFSENLY